MPQFDYFSGASERWKADAKVRARRIFIEHGENSLAYVRKRIDRGHLGSFERRRWTFIRKILLKQLPAVANQAEPLSST